jgi:hypothetical protein
MSWCYWSNKAAGWLDGTASLGFHLGNVVPTMLGF